jgi:endonuclease-3
LVHASTVPTPFPIDEARAVLHPTLPIVPQPVIDDMGSSQQSPVRMLVATILRLRTNDTLTAVVAPRLALLPQTTAVAQFRTVSTVKTSHATIWWW